MKTKFFKMATLVLAMYVTAPVLVSCSSDDDESSIEVGKTQYSINRIGGVLDVEVKASGAWTAEIPEKSGEVAWADVIKSSGTGNGTLQVVVDYFSPRLQKNERTTELIIRCGDKSQTVNLRQYVGLKENETVGNDMNQPFYDLWANKGLGAGYDIMTGNDATAKVLNLFNMKNDPEVAGLVTQTPSQDTSIDKLELDTTMNNTVGLSVNGKLDVNYAKFKLNIQVDYNNTGAQIQNVKTFNVTQALVFLSSRIDVPSFSSIMVEEPDLAKKVFTRGFRSIYNRITTTTDPVALKNEITNLIANYGPAIIAGSELGGSLFVSIRYDSLQFENNYKVDGKATTEATLGPLEIKGGVSVGYSRIGKDFYRNSQYHITCTGGSKDAIGKITDLLDIDLPQGEAVTSAAKTWVHSIISSNDSNDNTSVVRIIPVGIWQLFPVKLQPTIKAVAIEYFKGKKTCIDIEALQ